MKNMLAILVCLSASLGAFAKSEIRYMDELMKDSFFKQDSPGKILEQFKSKWAIHPQTGQKLQKVIWIEKGSAWEKAGVNVGDFLANGKAPINLNP